MKYVDKLSLISMIVPIVLFTIGTINTIAIFIILGIQVINIFIKIKNQKSKISITEKNILEIIIFFCILTYIIDIFGGFFDSTIRTTTLIFGSTIINFIVIFLVTNKEETFIYFFKIFVIFVVFLSLYGIILRCFGGRPKAILINGEQQYIQELKIGNISFTQRVMGKTKQDFGVASLTNNPNNLSYLSLYAFIINYIFIKINKEKNKKNYLYYLFNIILLIGIYISGSRLVIAVLPIVFLGIQLLYIKNHKLLALASIGIIICSSFSAIYLFSHIEYLKLIDLNGREMMWNTIPEIIEDNIFIGHGLDSSADLMLEKIGIKTTMFNIYFTFIANYGIFITIVFFVSYIYMIFKILKRTIKEKNDSIKKVIYAISVMLLTVSLIQGIVENNILRFSLWNMIYVIVIGMSVTLKNQKGELLNEKN